MVPRGIRHYFNIEGDLVIQSGLGFETSNELVRETSYKLFYLHNDHQEKLLSNLLGKLNANVVWKPFPRLMPSYPT